MTSRERVMNALSFKSTDRIPKDLGAMNSTSISAFAYPKLVEALGLPPRRPRVNDPWQMLAFPDLDVLDALGCDVVTVGNGITNAFEQPEIWHDYDFNGRLPARVRDPNAFKTRPDGTIEQYSSMIMPPTAHVFDGEHAGQPLPEFDQPLPLMDLKKYRKELDARAFKDETIKKLSEFYRKVRESTDRAVFGTDGVGAGIGIGNFGGLAVFPVICLEEPDYVRDLHEITIEHVIRNMRALLPEIGGCVDIVMTGCDDWGTQSSTIASPQAYRDLFMPYYRRVNDEAHRLVPGVKTFMHNCGAIYSILDMLIESGFDIINPIQWTAGGRGYREWKDRLRGRATAWGGGVGAQTTLARGTVQDVEEETRQVCRCFKEDGGFVYNSIHNLLAEVPAEKIVAMYRAASEL